MKFTSYKQKFLDDFNRRLDIAMELVAQQGESNAQDEATKLIYDTPPSPYYVRTGTLRNSIAHVYDPSTKTARIGTDLEYAPYVELGTTKMKARPFLLNAVNNYVKEYEALLKDALSKL